MTASWHERALRLAPHLKLVVLGPETAYAVGENQRYAIRGRAGTLVAMLLDNERTGREIVAAAAVELGEETAERALLELMQAGLARPAAAERGQSPEQLAFDSASGLVEPRAPLSASVQSCGGRLALAAAERMRAALAAADVAVRDDSELLVLVTDDYLLPDVVRRCDAWFEARGAGPRELALIKPTGLRALLGPIVRPGRGPCLLCLQHALARQRPLEHALAALGQETSVPLAALPASTDAACHLFAVALRRWLSVAFDRASLPLDSTVLAYDTAELTLTHHRVHTRPQCARCGDANLMAARGWTPLDVSSASPARLRDGGLRREDPARTYERLAPLVSDVLGPVTYVTPRATTEADELPVFFSGFMATPRARSMLESAGNPFDQVCAGKGLSDAQARMSALGEAIERCAGLYQGDEARIEASYSDLMRACVDGAELTRHPDLARALTRGPLRILTHDALQLFSARQLREGGSEARGARVPRPYTADVSVAWTPVWPIGAQGMALAPLGCIYTHIPEALGARHCAPSSNGSAAGTSLAEAALQGLLELVERDAVALWWYNRLRRPELSLDTLSLPASQAHCLEKFRRACARRGFETWLLDLTLDLGIPVAAAVAHHPREGRFAFGFGCHIEAALCASRAYSELAQLLGSTRASAPWDAIVETDHRFLFPCSEARRFAPDVGAPGHFDADHDAAAELLRCTARLSARGLQAFASDKSRPDLQLSVVQVIVPGLRHVWPRFAPGRLYDVPVQLGLRERPLGEDELNPVPLLI